VKVTDDHRLARIYIAEVYKEAGFEVGSPSWGGSGYTFSIQGYGITLRPQMIFTTANPSDPITINDQQVSIHDPKGKGHILDVTVNKLFDQPIMNLSWKIQDKFQGWLKISFAVPKIDPFTQSIDVMREKIFKDVLEVEKQLKKVKGALYVETPLTIALAKLRSIRNSKMSWKDKIKAFHGVKKQFDGVVNI
jgi:hypothetical protein